MGNTSLLDAISVVKENERLALTKYAESVNKVNNPICKNLFEELSKFETYHFERLSALEKSLQETGEFIDYQGREFPLPPILEIKVVDAPEQKSAMDIISGAMDLEKEASRAYADLSGQIDDPRGHAMFERLAHEERLHYQALAKVYDHLNTFGTMKWVGHDLTKY